MVCLIFQLFKNICRLPLLVHMCAHMKTAYTTPLIYPVQFPLNVSANILLYVYKYQNVNAHTSTTHAHTHRRSHGMCRRTYETTEGGYTFSDRNQIGDL